ALIEGIRLRCLSLARLGEVDHYRETLALLDPIKLPSAEALKHFLEGFVLRLNGQPEDAISEFKKSYDINPASFSTLRELSHALMIVGEIKEARKYAEQALRI